MCVNYNIPCQTRTSARNMFYIPLSLNTYPSILKILCAAMDIDCLRRIRLLLEDFPKNHNLVLIAQISLMNNLKLSVNEDIRSRITYSVNLNRLNPDDIKAFIFEQLDRVRLGHNTFSDEALDLIVRSSEGVLRKVRNLCVSTLLETVRDRKQVVGLEQVNKVLMQPHWRQERDMPSYAKATA